MSDFYKTRREALWDYIMDEACEIKRNAQNEMDIWTAYKSVSLLLERILNLIDIELTYYRQEVYACDHPESADMSNLIDRVDLSLQELVVQSDEFSKAIKEIKENYLYIDIFVTALHNEKYVDAVPF